MWYRIPKELIARYVKCCPSCAARRAQAGKLQLSGPMQSVIAMSAPYSAPYTPTCYSSASESSSPVAVPAAMHTQDLQHISQPAMLATTQQQLDFRVTNFQPSNAYVKPEPEYY